MSQLYTSVQYVKGVGPHIAALLEKRGIRTVSDLILHLPCRYIDRRRIASISDTPVGKERTIIAEVVTSGVAFLGRKRKRIFEVIAKDESGCLEAKWFHFNQSYMPKLFRKGTRVLFAGELTEYNGMKQFVHPEIEILGEDDDSFELGGCLLPIYPLTEGLSQRLLRKIVKNAWEKYEKCLLNPYPNNFLKRHNLMDFKKAVSELHLPPKNADFDLLNTYRTEQHHTVIFTEFFFLELALAIRKASIDKEKGLSFEFNEGVYKSLLAALPFELTSAQKRVIGEIKQDMSRVHPMNRLLQGDVGSGKTIVALAAAVQAVANGYQAVFMAPTEILAEQHYRTIAAIAEKLQIPCALLTAGVKGKMRDEIYKGIESGAIPILIGTHAVIQQDVKFAKLGLAIIDEQHRFGVIQRQALHKKGVKPDVLVMTATPIPRTLAMTLYGDLEISVIDEMPKGRKSIITRIYKDSEHEKLYGGIRTELERGHQIYVVYPLIEESEKIDLKNATEMSKRLAEIFSPQWRVELLHGRMSSEEKERIMSEFKSGKVHILAATSVVEVGVDVPNATVMAIEHSERFGLAQLHQLRGRVGRGDAQSFCIMIVGGRLSEESRRRLNIMVETTDGFKIAEEDLSIRGPGEFLGTRQSGIPEFKLANLVRDVGILQKARQAAFEIIANDPSLGLLQNRLFAEHIKNSGGVEFGKVA
ncbi:MAG: ATP-dependent DNA helicase RecG [Deltaproteobacteria bacterium]|nr:ATP-dependent DNA helicase RecG [Deltaproteobacteria bacterium]